MDKKQRISWGVSFGSGSTNNFNNNDQSSTSNDPFFGNSNQQGQFSNEFRNLN